MSDSAARILSALLESRTGQQLARSRSWRIETALQPVMRERGIRSLDELAAWLVSKKDPTLEDAAVEALLNNETFFFRDRAVFELLLGPALTRLERARREERRLSIWCAGCSTGQEAYSLAIRFAEQKLRWSGWAIDILATDVSRAAVEQARSGVYSQFEVQRGLSVLEMMRWFDQQPGTTWQIAREIRNMVRFEAGSLVSAVAPARPFDIILCRNVMLYFSAATRAAAFARLAAAIAADGVLALGAGETVIGQTDAFASDPGCRGLYIRTSHGERAFAAAS